MKILYIHQYFKTPQEGGAIRSWYIATDMVKAGYSVEMITAHNKDEYIHRMVDGISVHYLPVKYDNSYGFLRRIISFMNFVIKAYRYSTKIDNVNFAYITSTPLTVGLIALRLKSKKNIPYLFEVRDLWPEAPIQLGALKNKMVKKYARKLERRIYKNAEGIIALSPGIYSYVVDLFPGKPVHFCPNISDCSFFETNQEKDPDILQNYSLDGKFVLSYFGAIGWTNALDYLLNVADLAQKKKYNLQVLIIGEGAKKQGLVKRTNSRDIKNIHFIDHLNKYELKKFLSVIDAAYISFAGYPVLENNSPNKFFDALASGKMVISNVQGWIRDLIEENKCGFYHDPNNPEECLIQLSEIIENDEKINTFKINARNLAENEFERGKLVPGLLKFIQERFPPS